MGAAPMAMRLLELVPMYLLKITVCSCRYQAKPSATVVGDVPQKQPLRSMSAVFAPATPAARSRPPDRCRPPDGAKATSTVGGSVIVFFARGNTLLSSSQKSIVTHCTPVNLKCINVIASCGDRSTW